MPHQPYRVILAEWEGPLDLLLHVIRSHELDILNIPIAFVTEQYLNYLEVMQSMNLDIAAEYLEMAATLAYIKSRMLLPTPEAEEEEPEEEPDPREELIRRLLQYQRYKDAAQQLGSRSILGKDTFSAAHPPDEPGAEPMIELGVFELVDAFRKILDRTKLDLAHEVTTERITVSERIGEIVNLMLPNEQIPLEALLGSERTKLRLVVTLLALLEMCRLRMIRLRQAPEGGQIYASLRQPSDGLGRRRLNTTGVDVAQGIFQRPYRPLPCSRTLHLLDRDGRLPDDGGKGSGRWRARRRRNEASRTAQMLRRGRRR